MIDETKPRRYLRNGESVVAYRASSPLKISGKDVNCGDWIVLHETSGKVLEICPESEFTYQPA